MHGRVPQHVGAGVFDAELEAIARGLASLPVTCDVTIYTDCSSAITAISRYGNHSSARARLRSSGRQWLSLITRVRDHRNKAGALTKIESPLHTWRIVVLMS